MNLNKQLTELLENNKKQIPKEIQEVMYADLWKLIETGIEDNILSVWEKFPEVELLDAKGNKVALNELLKNGQIVLSFYRGGWCPYCNLELKALQNYIPEFEKLNAQLVAVSPETPDNASDTVEKNELTFPVLSDVWNVLAKQLKLTFNLEKNIQEIYSQFGIDVKKHNGDENFELPLAATYIIGTDGIIKHAEATANYTVRAEPEELLKYLK